ncbi:hypothetical protein Agub_g7068, partial [Astrephomene gubernaculifera]
MSRRQPAGRTDPTGHTRIPASIKTFLTQLPATVERLLGPAQLSSSQTNGSQMTPAALRSFHVQIAALKDFHQLPGGFESSNAVIAADRAIGVAVLRLMAAVYRLKPTEMHPDGSSPQGWLHSSICVAFQTLVDAAFRSSSLEHPLWFSRQIVRMECLQACARQLDAATGPLLASISASNTQEQRFVQSDQECHKHAERAICTALTLVTCLANTALHCVLPKRPLSGDLSYCQELVVGLDNSCVLEHLGRALMAVSSVPMDLTANPNRHPVALPVMSKRFSLVVDMLVDVLEGISRVASLTNGMHAVGNQLRKVLSGSCLSHAVIVHGLAGLCALDGGSWYGLPLDVRRCATRSVLGAVEPVPQLVPTTIMRAFVKALSFSVPRPLLAAPPLSRRAALPLALRACHAAIASLQAPAASAAASGGFLQDGLNGRRSEFQERSAGGVVGSLGNGAERQPPSSSLQGPASTTLCSIGPGGVLAVALGALGAARGLRSGVPGSEVWMAEAEEWWRMVATVAGDGLQEADAKDQEVLGHLLGCDFDEDYLPLRYEAPDDLTAALAGGLLPCLERLLRRAGQLPLGPEAGVLRKLLGGDPESCSGYLVALLGHGDQREAVSLLATLGKLLRVAEAAFRMAKSDSAPFASSDEDGLGTPICIVRAACLGLIGQVVPMDAGRQQEGELSPVDQWMRLQSYAAAAWLPTLSRILRHTADRVLQELRRRPGGSVLDKANEQMVWILVSAVLGWLDLMLHRFSQDFGVGSRQKARAEASNGAAGKWDEASEGGDDGWQQFLLEEVRVVPLLGAIMHLLPLLADLPTEALDSLATCCCTVAGEWPKRMRLEALVVVGSEEAQCSADILLWRPALLAAIPKLQAKRVHTAGVKLLARRLEAWRAGEWFADEDESGASELLQLAVASTRPLFARKRLALSTALAPPARVARMLRTCGYPGCTNLAG